MFRALIQGLSQTLQSGVGRLPSRCAVCHAWPAEPVCEACVTAFAQPVPRCETCALPVPSGMRQCGACIKTKPPLDAAMAAVSYDYPWSLLVSEFKFREHTGWARTFASLMRSTPWVEPALDEADLVLPMPLSRQRMAERGYNQATLLAQALGTGKIDTTLLVRVLDSPPQRTLPRKERLVSVQNAFTVDPLKAHLLPGKRVVLVDDVMTSGASLHAAAHVVRRAGADHITAMVFARTE
jgi:ComF family protein